ncbi:MAG: GNAT family N-acetyltransferase [Bacteroidia bacterium]
MKLSGQHISLRALEPTDVDLLYQWENDTEVWEVSHTQTPFSKLVLKEYLSAAYQDIYTTKQLRLVIETTSEKKAVGCIDLFDFEPNHQRVGVGILIANKDERRKNYATEALGLLKEYCFTTLNVHQIFCNITTDNEPSILLFQKEGFEITGIKKQWIRSGAVFKDEFLLQLIRK